MARFEAEGFDELLADFQQHKDLFDAAVPEILQAGANVIADAWRDAIRKHGLIDTGEMLESVRAFDIETSSAKKAVIYPAGKDSKGVRNAEKAFVNHYGASSIKATHFVDDAENEAEGPAVDAMAAVWFKKIDSEG